MINWSGSTGGRFRGWLSRRLGDILRRGFWHLEATDYPLGCRVGDISPDDLIFTDEQGGIHRLGGSGVVIDLIDIAHHRLTGIGAEVIALTFLQGIVAVENF